MSLKMLDRDDDRYITKQEAADLLSVSVRTIDSYIKRGILRKHKIGGFNSVRLWRPDVLALAEADVSETE